MKIIRPVILFGTLAAFLWLINSGIIGAENRIANGTPVYLQLAPVDPRSLIQGDYMRLRYAIENDIRTATDDTVRRGTVVAQVDEQNVAHFSRMYEGGELTSDERLLNFRRRDFDVVVGVDSFFFQEGLADAYADAEFAEVRVTSGGGVMLIDLVGENFEQLVP